MWEGVSKQMLTDITFTVKRESPLTEDELSRIAEFTGKFNKDFTVEFQHDAQPNEKLTCNCNCSSNIIMTGQIIVGRAGDYIRTNNVNMYWINCLNKLTEYLCDCEWKLNLDALPLIWKQEKGWCLPSYNERMKMDNNE